MFILFQILLMFAGDGVMGSSATHKNLALLPTNCGGTTEDRILTSVPSLDEFPWMALIAYQTREGMKFECTGTIINPLHILTAAQCVHGRKLTGVRVGDYDISSNQDCLGDICQSHIQDIIIEEKIVHENFTISSGFLKDDIALLRVKEPINFSYTNVGPICLPVTQELRDEPLKGRARVVVWGLNMPDNINRMRKFDVSIVPHETCRSKYNRTRPASENDEDNAVCVMKGEHLYSADTGGPLFLEKYYGHLRYVQYGVHSKEPSGDTDIYTDVTKYIDWILNNIRE